MASTCFHNVIVIPCYNFTVMVLRSSENWVHYIIETDGLSKIYVTYITTVSKVSACPKELIVYELHCNRDYLLLNGKPDQSVCWGLYNLGLINLGDSRGTVPKLQVNKSSDWSFTWGMIHTNIRLLRPLCSGLSASSQCIIVGWKHSFTQ